MQIILHWEILKWFHCSKKGNSALRNYVPMILTNAQWPIRSSWFLVESLCTLTVLITRRPLNILKPLVSQYSTVYPTVSFSTKFLLKCLHSLNAQNAQSPTNLNAQCYSGIPFGPQLSRYREIRWLNRKFVSLFQNTSHIQFLQPSLTKQWSVTLK